MVGDFGGGGMLLAFGVVCGLLEAQRSGAGQVIDAAMVDGAAALMTMIWTMHHSGLHDISRRGANMLDTGAHFYDTYECADGEYVSIGSIEPQFYAELLRLTGLDGRRALRQQHDRAAWPRSRPRWPSCSARRPAHEWCAVMEHTDVCFAPVLRLDEAPHHPHNVARATFVEPSGRCNRHRRRASAAPCPSCREPPAHDGQHTREVLTDWGIAPSVEALIDAGAVRQA